MSFKSEQTTIEQLDLFQPAPNRPSWKRLPEYLRAQVRELLAQMLRNHSIAGAVADKEEVSGD